MNFFLSFRIPSGEQQKPYKNGIIVTARSEVAGQCDIKMYNPETNSTSHIGYFPYRHRAVLASINSESPVCDELERT